MRAHPLGAALNEAPRYLDLVESRVDSNGVSIQVYRPAGRPR
ncbi:hypothetical protein [Streptacidiphilus sp. EB129]